MNTVINKGQNKPSTVGAPEKADYLRYKTI